MCWYRRAMAQAFIKERRWKNMKIGSILAYVALVGGLLISNASANAQTFDLQAQAASGSGATGTYHVILTELTSTSFSVFVQGNNDGDKHTPYDVLRDKHSLDVLSFTFSGGGVNKTLSNGGTTSGADASGTYTASGPYDKTGTAGTLAFQGPDAPDSDVAAYGGNSFSGTIFLKNPFTNGNLKIALQDGGQQWNANASLTPEAASLAMLLPGLLPIGLALRRRRANRA